MIPKVIHYCWFGGNDLPKLAEKCIESWKKYCPDYQIKRWDESNFDVNIIPYTKEAYEAKKFAFVTDYVRLLALYNEGGIYMDTDVELIKNIDIFLVNKAFSGFEDGKSIPTGIMASEKGLAIIKEMLDYYSDRHFVQNGTMDTQTNVAIITNMFLKYGFSGNNLLQTIKDFTFYPKDFFCPKSYETGEIVITENTHAIHHFNASWQPLEKVILRNLTQKYELKYGKKGKLIAKIVMIFRHPILTLKIIKKKVLKKS